MDIRNFESILTVGENVAVEFKRCGSGIGNDVYESICSFLNRFGGDLFMGVEDDGTVVGLPEKAASVSIPGDSEPLFRRCSTVVPFSTIP